MAVDAAETLAEVLSEFARTMLTDFPIQAILDRLVERIVEVLPVSGAGVTLISEHADPRFIAASNDAALQLETLQSTLGLGPCVLAHDDGRAVSVPDIAVDARFPQFAESAAAVGVAAAFAFPMRHNAGRLGALDLYQDEAGPLEPWAMSAAQTLADVAAAYLLNAQARQRSEQGAEALRASSLHDALTGLPNRVMLQERLEHAAERAHRSRSQAAVLYADLDGFKQVNDTHGHPVGDALLVAVARRMSALLRPGDTLARVSGDEFVILCEDLSSAGDVDALARRIGEAFSTPFTVSADGRGNTRTRPAGLARAAVEIMITASVGIAFAGHADDIGHQLIHDADLAMYQAKRKGGASHQLLDLPEAARASERLELQGDLADALERNDLSLAYQPIVRTADGAVTGVEALLRWTHVTRGPISALAAIALAEQSTLINTLGTWVLERALRDRSRWLEAHPDHPLDLAVNVSPRQLMSAGLVDTVQRVLDRTGMDPHVLTLEVTESIFLDNSARAMTVLRDLKDLGVQLALDDFGTGYSSLSYLRQYPVDMVKIDQSFVADIGVVPAGGAIVAAVTNLAHVLGLSVTAEGVETAAQHDAVRGYGCESAQGYLYAKPITAVQVGNLLGRGHPGVASPPQQPS